MAYRSVPLHFGVICLWRDVQGPFERFVNLVDDDNVSSRARYKAIYWNAEGKLQTQYKLDQGWFDFVKKWKVRAGEEGLPPKDCTLMKHSLSDVPLLSPFAAEIVQLIS
jgi:hypothetical protein